MVFDEDLFQIRISLPFILLQHKLSSRRIKIKGNNEKLLFPTAKFKFGKEHKRISFTSL